MKHLCCNKLLFIFLIITTTLFANIKEKSAIVYYGKNISYPMVGIHDYIIVQPKLIDTSKHGFNVYKNKIYAYVSIGEINTNIDAYKKLNKKLIVGKNNLWGGKLLNLRDPAYKKFLFEEMIDPQIKRGFKNFFFDTIDSYQLIAKTVQERRANEKALVDIIHSFKKRYPHSKLIINRGFEIIDQVHSSLEAVLFESYYHGLGGTNLGYKKVSNNDRKWLDIYLNKIASYHLNIICVDYLPLSEIETKGTLLIKKLKKRGFIPYIATRNLTSYGRSSKNAIKREILTLINENQNDKIYLDAHRYGALPLEYQGYIQKLYNVATAPLPTMQEMQQYGGVIIWLSQDYKEPNKLIKWIIQLQKYHIKVVFANSFSINNIASLKALSISEENYTNLPNETYYASYADPMMNYEFKIPSSPPETYIHIRKGKALYEVKNSRGESTTLAAIMPWGGFALSKALMIELNKDDLWTINPFKFFKKALRLQTIPIPDTTTENGKRILFSHVDGDGIMSRVEWNPKLFSGDTLYSDILKKFNIPISISVIGSDINENGLYPKLAPSLQKIVKKIYALPNVEPATHTFTHPFFWNKIHNNHLSSKYRLNPKAYHFSLNYEIKGMLEEINKKFLPKNKFPKAKTIFWTGDCAPTEKVLRFVYKNHILNINGGDTSITNLHPWLGYIAPMGIERGGYYQIYTGEQNENIYTHEWHGPFWGFKKVIQTFKLTNEPKRIKPIDIYYHFYSSSKRASINALKYVYNWAIHEEVNPIFTSQYIPKVMDYYTVSITKNKNSYLIDGMQDLKTIRLKNFTNPKNLQLTQNIAGYKQHKKDLYVHLGTKNDITISKTKNYKKEPYLVSSNGKVLQLKRTSKTFRLKLKATVALKFELFLPKECHYTIEPKNYIYKKNSKNTIFSYMKNKEAIIDARCKL